MPAPAITSPTGGAAFSTVNNCKVTPNVVSGTIPGVITGGALGIRDTYGRFFVDNAVSREGCNFSAVCNASTPGTFLLFRIRARAEATRLLTLAQDGLEIGVISGSAYKVFAVTGSDQLQAGNVNQDTGFIYSIDPAATSTTLSGGTFVPSSITAVEFIGRKQNVANDPEIVVEGIFQSSILTLTQGEVSSPGTFNDFFLAARTFFSVAGTNEFCIRKTLGRQYYSLVSLQIGGGSTLANPTYFSSSGESLEFPEEKSSTFGFFHAPNSRIRLNLYPRTGDTILIDNFLINGRKRYQIDSQSAAAATFRMSNGSVIGVDPIALESPQAWSNVNFSEDGEIALNGASISGGSITKTLGSSGVLLSLSGFVLGTTIENNTVGVRINTAGSYTNHTPILRNNTSRDVLISSGVTGGGTVSINISSFTFSASSTTPTAKIRIEDTTGTINLTVPSGISSANISSAGATVNVIAPAVSLSAPSIANGSRVYAGYVQIFTVASTAINTTTNAITLGTDSNSQSPAFASSSPYTLVRFELASGASLPATTGNKLRNGGLYYCTLSGGAILLFASASDIPSSPIDFTSQGSGNFTLTAETELANTTAVILGYSQAFTLPNNARVRFKALHWYKSSGNAKCSTFLDTVVAWSSTAGATILDVVDADNSATLDTVHQVIVDTTSLVFEGTVEDATGALISSVTLPNSGDDAALAGALSFVLEGRGKIQVNASDADGIMSWQELYLWSRYVFSTAAIRIASATTAQANNFYNYQFSGLEFEEITGVQLKLVGGIGRSSDGSDFISSATVGSIVANAASRGTGAIVSAGGGGGGATAAEIWTYSARSLTDKAGFSLSTAGIQAIWDAATSALTAVGSIGKRIADFLDIAVSSRSTYAGADTSGTTTLLSRLTSTRAANLDNLDATITSRLATAGYTAPPTASAIASAVWSATTRALTDKAGFELSTAERTALATGIEAALINEGDGQMLIDAILDVINSNLDLPALELTAIAQAVHAELTELARLDVAVSSRLADADYTAPLDSTQVQAAAAAALTAYDPPTRAEATADKGEVLAAIGAIPAAPSASANAAAVRVSLATELGRIDQSISSRAEPGDVAVTVDGGFGASDRTDLQATKRVAEATAKGRFANNFAAGEATQYDAAGLALQVFDLLDADGNPVTSAQAVVERRPKP